MLRSKPPLETSEVRWPRLRSEPRDPTPTTPTTELIACAESMDGKGISIDGWTSSAGGVHAGKDLSRSFERQRVEFESWLNEESPLRQTAARRPGDLAWL